MTATQTQHRVVARDEWLEARLAHLAAEKEFVRKRDELSQQRRELPWERVEKDYVFEGPEGPRTLGDLFGGRSQLIMYHFMLGPNWEEGCKSCSFLADHFDATRIHLAHRDVTFAAVSRARVSRIEAFKRRMGWRFPWVSAFGTDFQRDYGVHFTTGELAGEVNYNYGKTRFGSEEAPGLSVFYKDEEGEIFHTYSTYARGLDALVGTYQFLDLVPKGRDEDGLAFTMAWVRHHDKYEDYVLDPTVTYEKPGEMGTCCGQEEGA
ncbi:MAG TPA: thioredoxin family protein [Bryobacteraceae bacterium]|jgi:predicted dithiol-disulfide oxidoreductase (DUF899 family)|nr:thioredoxin family protein [Bryobacteraceae bacterium]